MKTTFLVNVEVKRIILVRRLIYTIWTRNLNECKHLLWNCVKKKKNVFLRTVKYRSKFFQNIKSSIDLIRENKAFDWILIRTGYNLQNKNLLT